MVATSSHEARSMEPFAAARVLREIRLVGNICLWVVYFSTSLQLGEREGSEWEQGKTWNKRAHENFMFKEFRKRVTNYLKKLRGLLLKYKKKEGEKRAVHRGKTGDIFYFIWEEEDHH